MATDINTSQCETVLSRPHIPSVMNAIAYAEYGGPEALDGFLRRTPQVKPGQILIQVHAAGVNPIDYRLRSGEAKWLLFGGFPRIPGYDVAGEVVAEQSNGRFSIGDHVFAFLDNKLGGGYAEYAVCSANCAAPMPDAMSFEEAAAIPLAGTTALQSLRDHGAIKRGERVLINGASGGVGAFAVQIAKAYATEVTAVASAENEQFVRTLGADVFIDHEQEDFTASNRSWDLIFDAAGKSSYVESRKVMNHGGRFVSTEPSISGVFLGLASQLLDKSGCVMLANPNSHDLEELAKLYESGALKVTLSHVLPIIKSAQSHRILEEGNERGKIVLSFS